MTGRTLARVYLSLGSNVGLRWERLCAGIDALKGMPGTEELAVSRIYRTEPWGMVEQPPFLNCVVELETDLEPEELLERLQAIEQSAGRSRGGVRWGPRELDIDILIYGDRLVNTDYLVIPHPRLIERRFVLLPLCELAPELEVPGLGLTVEQALEHCGDQGEVILYRHGGEG